MQSTLDPNNQYHLSDILEIKTVPPGFTDSHTQNILKIGKITAILQKFQHSKAVSKNTYTSDLSRQLSRFVPNRSGNSQSNPVSRFDVRVSLTPT